MRWLPHNWQQVLEQLPVQQTLGLELSTEQLMQEVLPLIEDSGMNAHLSAPAHEGFLLFIKGELLSAQCGNQNSVNALDTLYGLPEVQFSGQVLPYEHARALLALTHGNARSKVPSSWEEVHLSLYQEVFTGCLLLEQGGGQTQVCLWVDGTPLHPLSGFGPGTFHVLEVPQPLPPNIMLAYRTYQQQKRNAEIHSLWFRLEVILREFVGKGAPAALQHLKQLHRNAGPEELRTQLRGWLQDTLDDDALAMFDA